MIKRIVSVLLVTGFFTLVAIVNGVSLDLPLLAVCISASIVLLRREGVTYHDNS